MWAIAGLLLIAFALILFSMIAKTPWMRLVFFLLGMAVYIVVCSHAVHTLRNEDDVMAFSGFALLSIVIAHLIAIPIWRKRVVMPPCVRVKRASQSGNIAMIILFIAFVIFFLVTGSFRGIGQMIFFGLLVVLMTINLIRPLFEKIEICGNGVWEWGRLWPWEEYKSFLWWNTEDRVVLRLVPKSWIWPATRLVVPREDHEAVHQLLAGNLPDLSK
jgi:hypothetical protein